MESPATASEMACPMVLQAVWRDLQLLLSLPFTPSTYHVVLATTAGAKAKKKMGISSLPNKSPGFISLLQCGALWARPCEVRSWLSRCQNRQTASGNGPADSAQTLGAKQETQTPGSRRLWAVSMRHHSKRPG